MGYYIEGRTVKGKAQYIVDELGGEIVPRPALFADVPEGKALICVVDNGLFEAAGFACDEREFEAFAAEDTGPAESTWSRVGDMNVLHLGNGTDGQRPRTWVLMDRKRAEELSGYAARNGG